MQSRKNTNPETRLGWDRGGRKIQGADPEREVLYFDYLRLRNVESESQRYSVSPQDDAERADRWSSGQNADASPVS